MKPTEAEKLLGGYATGTLTEAERTVLFAAALEHQEIFDALADEEALRELLADPVARTQLLAALAPAVAPKVVPFWRRTGVLGAAAGLLVAATAGLAYLRNPEQPTSAVLEAAKAKALKSEAVPSPASVAGSIPESVSVPAQPPGAKVAAPGMPAGPEPKAASAEQRRAFPPVPVPVATASAPPNQAPRPVEAVAAAPSDDSLRINAKADQRRVEAQYDLAKTVHNTRSSSTAVVEVVSALKEEAPEPKKRAKERSTAAVPGGVSGGLIGGVVGGVVDGAMGRGSSPLAGKAKADGQIGMMADPDNIKPGWRLESRPDGGTWVEVMASRNALLVLLKRSSSGVAVLQLQPQKAFPGDSIPWHCEVRMAAGESLDLYLLRHATADPSALPETGPVEGFRARIFPAASDPNR